MKRGIVLLSAVLLAAGCTLPEVQESRVTVTGLEPGEAVTVISGTAGIANDEGIPFCTRWAMEDAAPALRIVSAEEFGDVLSPWFGPGATPTNDESLSALLARPAAKKRIEELAVRYIISVRGRTAVFNPDPEGSTEEYLDETGLYSFDKSGGLYAGKHGFMVCDKGGYIGGRYQGGCMGLVAGIRRSHLSARVWDIRRGVFAGTIGVKVAGVLVMPAYYLPVPLMAPTESTACAELGTRLVAFVGGDGPPETKPDTAPAGDFQSE